MISLFIFYSFLIIGTSAWQKCTKYFFTDKYYSQLCGEEIWYPCGDVLMEVNFTVSVDVTTSYASATFSNVTYKAVNNTYTFSEANADFELNTYDGGNKSSIICDDYWPNPCNYPFDKCTLICNGTYPLDVGMQTITGGYINLYYDDEKFDTQFKSINIDNNIPYTLFGRVITPENSFLEIDPPDNTQHNGSLQCIEFTEEKIESYNERCTYFESNVYYNNSNYINATYNYTYFGGEFGKGSIFIDVIVNIDFSQYWAIELDNQLIQIDMTKVGSYHANTDIIFNDFYHYIYYYIMGENSDQTGYIYVGPVFSIDGYMLKNATHHYTREDNCVTREFNLWNGDPPSFKDKWYTSFCCTQWVPIQTNTNLPATTTAISTSCPKGWFQSKIDSKTCYYFSSLFETTDFRSANHICSMGLKLDAKLTSIMNAFENSEIFELMKYVQANDESGRFYFIGLYTTFDYRDTNTSWKWVSGENVTYTNWKSPQQASNTSPYECVEIDDETGKWLVTSCISALFICKLKLP